MGFKIFQKAITLYVNDPGSNEPSYPSTAYFNQSLFPFNLDSNFVIVANHITKIIHILHITRYNLNTYYTILYNLTLCSTEMCEVTVQGTGRSDRTGGVRVQEGNQQPRDGTLGSLLCGQGRTRQDGLPSLSSYEGFDFITNYI